MAHDFMGLTLAQQRLLTFHGWDDSEGAPRPRPNTLKTLVDRGLVTTVQRLGGRDIVAVRVPIDVHIAWCQHCEREA